MPTAKEFLTLCAESKAIEAQSDADWLAFIAEEVATKCARISESKTQEPSFKEGE